MSRLSSAAPHCQSIGKEIHANFGIVEGPSTPEEFARRFRDDGPVWMSLVRELGVTLD